MKKLLLNLSILCIFFLSCTQEITVQPNTERLVYVTKNTFSHDFNRGMEIYGDQQWDGSLSNATHIVFDTADMTGTLFPLIDTLFVKGYSGGASFDYRIGRMPTNDFVQYSIESVNETQTSGVFRYGVRYSVQLVW